MTADISKSCRENGEKANLRNHKRAHQQINLADTEMTESKVVEVFEHEPTDYDIVCAKCNEPIGFKGLVSYRSSFYDKICWKVVEEHLKNST